MAIKTKSLISHLSPITLIKRVSLIFRDFKLFKWFTATRRRKILSSILAILVLLTSIRFLFIKPKVTQAAWSPYHSSYNQRKQLTLINNSGQTFESGTTYKITIDTKALYDTESLLSTCDDLRIVYQPDDDTSIELKRNIEYAPDTTCSTSPASQVVFQLQANIADSATDIDYYIYFDDPTAPAYLETDTLAAYNIGNKKATFVAPFNGTTEAIASGSGTPTTASGAIRYSGAKTALEFDGESDYITVTDSSSIQNLPAGKFTAEAWIYIDTGPTTDWKQKIIVGKSNSSGYKWHMSLIRHNGQDTRLEGNIDNVAISSSTTSVDLTGWHHVAMTYDNSGDRKINLFIDGEEVSYYSENAMTGSYSGDSSQNLTIGDYSNHGDDTALFDGKIDEIRVSNIIRYSSNFVPQSTPFIRDEFTKLLLHFDEGGDDPYNGANMVTYDDSGNGNNGVITGAKYVTGLVGIDNSSSTTGYQYNQFYAGHGGIYLEEGVTNLINNPSFEHSTFDTSWSASASATLSINTTSPYYKFGSNSAKMVVSGSDASLLTTVNVTATTHSLSAYVYDATSGNEGGTVSTSVANLMFDAKPISTTYKDMGGGWWRLISSGTGSGSDTTYGVQVKDGKTVYIDGVQLEESYNSYFPYQTTFVDGSFGTGYSWSGTENNSASTRTETDLRYQANTNINPTTGSISFWIKPSTYSFTNSWYQDLFYVGDGGGYDDSENGSIQIVQGGPIWGTYVHIKNSSGTQYTISDNEILSEEWHHLCLVWNTNDIHFYIDGTVFGTPITSATMPTAWYANEFRFAELPIDGYTFQDFRAYNQALTANEVSDLYYSGFQAHMEQNVPTQKFSGDDSPVLAWHFDDGFGTTAYDSTVNLNHGSISGASWSEDSFGGTTKTMSLKFDGSDDYAYRSYSSDTEMNPSTNPFAVSSWFKGPNSPPSSQMNLISRYSAGGYKVYMNTSGQMCFGIDDDISWGPDDEVCTPQTYTDSKWHHTMAVKGDSNISLYIDGVKLANKPFTVSSSVSGVWPTFYVGVDSGGSSNFWQGFIDEVRVYDIGRTDEQVKAEYNARGSTKGVSTQFGTGGSGDSLNQGLVGYWKMDESTANTCPTTNDDSCDSSGNSYDGAWNGDTTSSDGKFGSGVALDGTGDYIEVEDIDI